MTPGIETTPSTPPSRILIVEDESIIAFNLQETLESLGYLAVAIASSSERALRKAAELRPDLVLMDIRIKGAIDGIQTAEQIWERFQIPVIYVTGHSDRSTVERAKLTAPFGYLLKPIKERELYVAIEAALQRYEREQWMRAVLKGMGDGVIVVDREGSIKFFNPIAEVITGWSLAEVRDRSILEVFNVINEQTRLPIEHPITLILEQPVTTHLEQGFLLTTKQGTLIPIADSIASLRNNNGTIIGAVIVFRDITARRQAEERNQSILQAAQLQQAMAELERINQMKDDFLNIVSHELRTPITNIKMSIQMLGLILDQQGMLSPENNPGFQSLRRYLNILDNQCDHEIRLINDLLDLQRLNADRYGVELTLISLSDWLPHLLETFEARCQERQLTLQLAIAPNLPPLMSDLLSLNRILSELLNNACKYTPPGGQIRVEVSLQQPDTTPADVLVATPTFQIMVCNTGVEISIEDQTRVFEPFYRVPQSDYWNQGGTGLGLALVQRLVTCLNGSIQIESGSNQTCFIVKLPV